MLTSPEPHSADIGPSMAAVEKPMDAHVGTGAGGGAEGLGGSGARVQQRHMVSVPNWQLPPLVAPEGQPPPGPHTLPGMRTSPGPHRSGVGPSMAASEKPMDAHGGGVVSGCGVGGDGAHVGGGGGSVTQAVPSHTSTV